MNIEKKYCYEYPRPALTTDCVIFGYDCSELKILLIERGIEPFKGNWAFPGGFVHENETTEQGAVRELFEETSLKDVYIEQLYTFSDVDRDPRGRVVSVVYFALVKLENQNIKAGDDAKNAKWFSISEVPDLAFDHQKILEVALTRLKGKIRYQPIGFELLSQRFTLPQLQQLYESILGISLDKRNFRKKIKAFNLIKKCGEKEKNVSHRAAELYMFNKEKYKQLSQQGFNFEI